MPPRPGSALSSCRPLLASVLLMLGNAPQAAEIRIGGTGSALGIIKLLGDAYTQKHPGERIIVLPSLGSSGAIKAIPAGKLDIGISARPLTDAERAEGTREREFAVTPTVFAVATRSKVRNLTRVQIAEMYRGTLTQWADGTPIRPLLRQAGDDHTRQIKTLDPAIEQALQEAEKRPGLPYATTDNEATDKLESIPGAVGVTTIGQIRSENRALRPLAIEQVEPTEKNARNGSYPLVKRLYFITPRQPTTGAEKFIQFTGSPAGRALLRQSGYWSP